MSTFYNSMYYVVGLLVMLGLGVAIVARCVLRPAPLRSGDWNFTFYVLRITPYAARSTNHALCSTQHVSATLYFIVPFVFYLFLVFDPRTHVYTFYPGAALLAGVVASRLWERIRARRGAAVALAVAGAGWYALCAGYIGLAFVNHTPEYKREWPASQSWLYPTTFQELPLFGFFGFPYQAGWKAVEGLYAQGVLSGTYASNEEPEITTWYVRSSGRCCGRTLCGRPDLYVIADHVQDEVAIDREELKRDYSLLAEISVEGRSKLHIYRRGAGSPSAPAASVDVESFARAFGRGTTVAAQLPSRYGGAHPVGVDLTVARLLGYDLSSSSVGQGGALTLTLYWQALSSPRRNYQVFTHLVAGGELIGQHDGAPACALAPTSGWELGQVIRDEHVIPLGQAAPAGKAMLQVGLYDLITQERVPVAGAPEGALSLAEVEILP